MSRFSVPPVSWVMAFANASHFTIGDAQFINANSYYELSNDNGEHYPRDLSFKC
jgi:hypothetical protein